MQVSATRMMTLPHLHSFRLNFSSYIARTRLQNTLSTIKSLFCGDHDRWPMPTEPNFHEQAKRSIAIHPNRKAGLLKSLSDRLPGAAFRNPALNRQHSVCRPSHLGNYGVARTFVVCNWTAAQDTQIQELRAINEPRKLGLFTERPNVGVFDVIARLGGHNQEHPYIRNQADPPVCQKQNSWLIPKLWSLPAELCRQVLQQENALTLYNRMTHLTLEIQVILKESLCSVANHKAIVV